MNEKEKIAKFNIILEDGGIYRKVAVLTGRGFARNIRDVHCAIKYEHGITVWGKHIVNQYISSKIFYEVEEVIILKQEHKEEKVLDENIDNKEKEKINYISQNILDMGGKNKMKNFCIINLIGPSGAGKTTLGNFLKKIGVPEAVSHTSRIIRKNEVKNVSYYFVSKDVIQKMIDNDEVVEKNCYCGELYCLSKKEVEDKLKISPIIFAITEINGTKMLQQKYENAVYPIFIYTDEDSLRERLVKRGDSEDTIKERITQLHEANELDNSKYAKAIIKNDNLDKAKKELIKIVDNIKNNL